MSEGELVDAFRHVSDAFEQTSETISQRANNAINDLRQPLEPLYQRNYRRQCDLSSTPLGIGITDYYIRQRDSRRCVSRCSCRSSPASEGGGRRGRGR